MNPFRPQFLIYRIYMMIFKFVTWCLPFREPELLTGPGAALEMCRAIAGKDARKLLLVTDEMLPKLGLIAPIEAELKKHGMEVVIFDRVQPDPTIALIEEGLKVLQDNQCDAILAVGGGSSMDAAKVIAARAKNNKPISKMAGLFRVFWGIIPLYVVPTTAGTGSEVTIAAVVSDPENRRKFAIIDLKLVPEMAALDAELMKGLPPHITSATGMDALTHAVEAYISNNALKRTDEKAIAATQIIMKHLPTAVHDGQNTEARQQMALASYYAGFAFTQAGVGYVHAISHNFGARYHTPHGLGNAIVLPYVLEYSKPNCAQRLAELAEYCGMKSGNESVEELAERFIDRIREMNADFGIPTKLDALQASDIPEIADAALKEARFTYAVPRYMDQKICEDFITKILPI